MIFRKPLFLTALAVFSLISIAASGGEPSEGKRVFRLGLIGTTTSHVPAAIDEINKPDGEEIFREFKITSAYVGGMPDNPDSWGRREKFSRYCVEKGLTIYPTIDEMLPDVDGILLMSVDGRCHLEQARPVIAAGKPLYLDKPVAGCLSDVLALYRMADEANVPIFSASSLRYSEGFQKMRNEKPLGEILGAEGISPCKLNPKHPDLYYYGVHGVETLFTLMGKGCVFVSRTHSDDFDLAVGTWDDGRIGVFRGMRKGGQYGGIAVCEKGTVNCGEYGGYHPLFVEICRFFKTGVSPIDSDETINMFAFMSAADESLRQGGKTVSIEEVMKGAEEAKSATIRATLHQDGSVLWNGETVAVESVSDRVAETSADGSFVRVILDNRAGADFSVVEKILIELDDAYLADYLY